MLIAAPHNSSSALLLDKRVVAEMIGCSTRHLDRLAADGRMPPPMKIGSLVRFRQSEIEDWIAAGCPSINDRATLPSE